VQRARLRNPQRPFEGGDRVVQEVWKGECSQRNEDHYFVDEHLLWQKDGSRKENEGQRHGLVMVWASAEL
jgi:hypothetical protein